MAEDNNEKWGPKEGKNVIQPGDKLPAFHIKGKAAHHQIVKKLENLDFEDLLPSGVKVPGEKIEVMRKKLSGPAYQKYLESLAIGSNEKGEDDLIS